MWLILYLDIYHALEITPKEWKKDLKIFSLGKQRFSRNILSGSLPIMISLFGGISINHHSYSESQFSQYFLEDKITEIKSSII